MNNMLAYLWGMSYTAYRLVSDTMDPRWSQLNTLAFHRGRETVHGTSRTLRMLKSQRATCFPPSQEFGPWLKYGRYSDARCGMPQDNRVEMVNILKKGSCYLSLYTQELVFLGICNYLPASGFSYAKYLRTCGRSACQGGKSFFPYEYVEDVT